MKQPYIIRCGHLNASLREDVLRGTPAFLHGLKLLFFSDTHVTPETTEEDIRRFIGLVNAQNADIVCIGGDIADNARDALRFIRRLDTLRAPMGVYAVAGNNDLEAFDGWTRYGYWMKRAGVRFLQEGCVTVSVGEGLLTVGGTGHGRYTLPDYSRIFRSAPEGSYRVFLDHYPLRPECRADLMLCGHTHGGQFRILGITPYTVGFERGFRLAKVAGLYTAGDMRMLVSRGVGASRIPYRVGVPPEINLLKFE